MLIVDTRKSLGMTAEQLSETLGVDATTVNKWENGVSFPRGDTCLALAEILGLTAGDVLLDINAEKQKRQRATKVAQ